MDKLKAFCTKYQTPILVTVTAGVALAIGIKIGKNGALNVLNQSIDAGLLEVTDAGNDVLGRTEVEA